MIRYPFYPRLVFPALIIMSMVVSFSCSESVFSHRAHFLAGIEDCSDCHEGGMESLSIEAGKKCSSCHKKGKQYRVDAPGRVSPPRRYGSFVFSHSSHANIKVPCDGCHEVELPKGERMTVPTRGVCLACHRKSGGPVDFGESKVEAGTGDYKNTENRTQRAEKPKTKLLEQPKIRNSEVTKL